MGRNISSAAKSPVKKFVEYKGGDGRFEYYDKEEKKRFPISLPARFIVLDDKRITVTGFNDDSNSGIYSNEVGNISKPLRVRVHKGGTLAEGPWEKIKDKVTSKSAGGRFCKPVYGIMKTEVSEEHPDGFEYVCFKFDGAAIGAWFDFQGQTNLMNYAVEIADEFVPAKKGGVNYNIPVFRAVKLTPESEAIADKMADPLEEYFKGYDSRGIEEDSVGEPETNGQASTFDGFSRETPSGKEKPETGSTMVETPDGFRKPGFEADDLPF